MNKITRAFLLIMSSMSIAMVFIPMVNGAVSPAPKPNAKKIEIEDPLLEDDLFETSLLEEDEKKKNAESNDMIKGDTPLEENHVIEASPILTPPPTQSKVEEANKVENIKDSENNKIQLNSDSPLNSKMNAESKPIAPDSDKINNLETNNHNDSIKAKSSTKEQSNFNLDPLQDSNKSVQKSVKNQKNLMSKSELGNQKEDQPLEILPRWDPKDPRKGFIEAKDDDAYYYKEESSDSNEKIYNDDNKTKPKARNYAKGLQSVASDGSYLYTIEESEIEGSTSVRVASMPPLPIENKRGISYEDVYGTSPMTVVLFDYDWLAFRKFGHWILSVGTGIGMKDGPGRFIDNYDVAKEVYTLYVLLNHISFVYRFQYSKKPWFVPYVSAGAVPTILIERRDDNKRNKAAFSPSIQGSGGVRINIGQMDSYGGGQLDAEYGINNMWLDVEFRRLQSFSKEIDISSNLFNIGLGFDF